MDDQFPPKQPESDIPAIGFDDEQERRRFELILIDGRDRYIRALDNCPPGTEHSTRRVVETLEDLIDRMAVDSDPTGDVTFRTKSELQAAVRATATVAEALESEAGDEMYLEATDDVLSDIAEIAVVLSELHWEDNVFAGPTDHSRL